jgi:hypothetical protein
MSFAILGADGWGWNLGSDKAFEVASRGGKIIAISSTSAGSAGDSQPPAGKLGEPTKKAEGKVAKLYVWDAGDNARFWMYSNTSAMPKTTAIIIGSKQDLEKLNFKADNPQSFVSNLESLSKIDPAATKKYMEAAKLKAEAAIKTKK